MKDYFRTPHITYYRAMTGEHPASYLTGPVGFISRSKMVGA
jgi:hypothetical protein